MHPMNIGQAAAAAGVTPKMIRHYESLGLIPEAERTEAGYRLYTRREVDMLRFVRQARTLGFPIQQIDSLLRLWGDEQRQSRAVKAVARAQLQELEQRRREIEEMQRTLEGLVADCAGDEGTRCAILDGLAAPIAREIPIITTRPASTLKEIKPGSRSARPRKAPAPAAHAGLEAWSRTFGAPA